MIEFNVEQFLPCNLPQVMTTVERMKLPDYDLPLYYSDEIIAKPMNKGFSISGKFGHFYTDYIDLLQSINGKKVNEICRNENDLRELEQYYNYRIISYEPNSKGRFTLQDINKKYFRLYAEKKTTWFFYTPQKIEIDLTKKCNFNCIHCSRDSSPTNENGEISHKDLIDIIINAAKLGVDSLTFMGGEPTCYEHLVDLALFAKTSGIRSVSTSTNGWLVDNELAKKMGNVFSTIQISIHGGLPETHDRIVGRSGAFERACNAVRLFQKQGVRELSISFTVMKENIKELPLMVELAKSLNIMHLRFLVLSPQGRGKNLEQLTNDDKDLISDYIKTTKKINKKIIEINAGGFPRYCDISNDAAVYGCPAGRSLMYISADKLVKPCEAASVVAGKLENGSEMMDLWHSPPMVEIRKKLTCECPYTSICAGGCLGNQYWLEKFVTIQPS